MRPDFDREIDRRNTGSLKYDFAERFGKPADALPLWVADMDFPAPPGVQDALRRMADHGIFGYSDAMDGYYEAVAAWFTERFSWTPERDWFVKTPGVVCALATAVRALTEPGDAVLIQPPVYRPFYEVVRGNGRRLVECELTLTDGRYEIDFAALEEKLASEEVRAMILCSPHNPVGRVWTREELRRLGQLCLAHGVMVFSDEIHCDFAFPEHPHTIFADACPEMRELCVICTAPSKSFNLAGLQASNIFIPDASLRRRFRAELRRAGFDGLNAAGLVAAQAAYETGASWLDECRAYMRGNLDYLRTFLAERLPELRLIEPEGTYFAWIDCSALGLEPDGLDDFIVHRARLWLDTGSIFGASAGQFQRVVLACTRRTLAEALTRLERAVRDREE